MRELYILNCKLCAKIFGKFGRKVPYFFIRSIFYICVCRRYQRTMPYRQVLPSFSQFSRVRCSFSRILIKKTLGKSKSNLRAQRDFVFLFLSFFFSLLSWVESIKARTPDGVAETQFLQNFSPLRKTFNRYFFKSIELQGYTFRLELFQYDL